MTENLPTTSSSGLPALAPSPLITGEDAAAYDDLATRIRTVLQPRDVFEELWARDAADLAWEVLRLRRLKAHLMRACAHEGMLEVLEPLLPSLACDSDNDSDDDDREEPCGDELAEQWLMRDAEATATVDKALAAAGLTLDAVMARTLVARIGDIERIERMMTAAEARRDNVLREVERRRAGAAARLRRAMAEAEDAEFAVVAPAIADASS